MIQSLEAHRTSPMSWTHQARTALKSSTLKQKKPHKAAFFHPSTPEVLRDL
ncbi:hypothetical protein [Pseudomonas sp. W5-01]|uniref:hypothetical protein n=1 Tax=Pseudomonas sp. W5-01 TaxID=3097454 RepID=UPI00397B2E9F